jgi:hypothetical protein
MSEKLDIQSGLPNKFDELLGVKKSDIGQVAEDKNLEIEVYLHAMEYSISIDFSDDHNLSEKGKIKIKDWAREDFTAGANWMKSKMHSDAEVQQLLLDHTRHIVDTLNIKHYHQIDSEIWFNDKKKSL